MATTKPEYDCIVGNECQSRDGTQTWRKKLAVVTFVSVGLALLGWQQRAALRGMGSTRGMDAIELSRSQPIVAALAPTPPVGLVSAMDDSCDHHDAISLGPGLLAVTRGGHVYIYQVPRLYKVTKLTHAKTSDWVNSAAFGTGYFASCDNIGDLIVYSVPAFQLLKRIDQGANCDAVTFGPDFVAAGGEDGSLNIYSLPSFDLLKHYSDGVHFTALAFIPGTLVAATKNSVRLYQVPGFQLMHTIHTPGVENVACDPGVLGVQANDFASFYSLFSPYGLLKTISRKDVGDFGLADIAFGMGHTMLSSSDGKVHVYSLPDYQLVKTISGAHYDVTGDTSPVLALQAPYMATCDWADTVRLYTAVL